MKKQAKQCITFLLALILTLTAVPALALPERPAPLDLGNSPINSLNGGMMLQAGETLYWADHGGIFADEQLLVEEPGRNLNLIRGGLYYTLGETPTLIRRYDLAGETVSTVLSWDAPIDQLFITGCGRILFLSQGRVYRGEMQDISTLQAEEKAFSVSGFIPTPYGTVYASGSLGAYTIYADNRQVATGVTRFFEEEAHLIIRRGAADYQIPMAQLFTGLPIEERPYNLSPQQISFHSHNGEEGCQICEAILLEEEAEQLLPITPLNNPPTFTPPLTVSQENVVKRARQQAEIQWTPLADIIGWRGNTVYRAGNTYRGIPYAQPVSRGTYIPWGASLSTFAEAVRNPTSVMYTSFSYHGSHATRAPFFGADCSSFVSWALDQPHRTHTGTFPNHAHRITQSIYALQVGDVFNSAGHNLIVTAVEFDAAGNLAAVETMEQTIPLPRLRRYGVPGNTGAIQVGGLQALVNRTFNSGFALYRSNTIDNVSFTPDPAVDVGLGPRSIITATASPGGFISPTGPIAVPQGDDITFTFQASRGFSVDRVLVNGQSVGAPDSFTFTNVQENAAIAVEFILTSSPFDDVSEGDWYFEAVLHTFREGFLTGTSETHFSPYVSTTRGMFVTILGRMAQVDPTEWPFIGIVTGSHVNFRPGPGMHYNPIRTLPRDTTVHIIGRVGEWFRVTHNNATGYMSVDFVAPQAGTFSDVQAGAFYAPYVEWANEYGIATGPGDGRFHPHQVITRQEMATLLYRYITNMEITIERDESLPTFVDIDEVAIWAQPGVTALQQARLIQGMGGNRFDPMGDSNRASVAVMITNFHSRYGR